MHRLCIRIYFCHCYCWRLVQYSLAIFFPIALLINWDSFSFSLTLYFSDSGAGLWRSHLSQVYCNCCYQIVLLIAMLSPLNNYILTLVEKLNIFGLQYTRTYMHNSGYRCTYIKYECAWAHNHSFTITHGLCKKMHTYATLHILTKRREDNEKKNEKKLRKKHNSAGMIFFSLSLCFAHTFIYSNSLTLVFHTIIWTCV